MITYQLVCVLVAVLVTGVLVRCKPEDTLDTSQIDSKPDTEEEESLQPEETGDLFSGLFGKLEGLKGKFYGRSGCVRDPCYPYSGGSYYRYVQVPVNSGGSAPSPPSYYYYYQGGAAAQQPSYSPGFYYLIGVPVNRPSVKVVPQPIPYRPVYSQPTVQCTQSPCGNVPQYIESRPYYGYGTGSASAGGQFLAGSSISSVESQGPSGGVAQEQIVGAASVPVIKGFTPSEGIPEIGKSADGVSAAASALDGVKC